MTSLTPFAKPALSIDQQLDLLKRRGMQIGQPDQARHVLTHISYYRLRAYWLPFEQRGCATGEHRFGPHADFATVLSIYAFDRELRLLVLDAIERIEISLRTRLANELTLRYGAFAHEDAANFQKLAVWQHSRDELAKEFTRSRETFAEHYRNQYPLLTSPPLWVACELMSLGHLSRWLQNIAQPKDRQAIANAYGLDERVLVSFVHHLTIVRNHCAHHGRIWNRKFSLKMLIPGKKPAGLAASFNPAEDRRIYNTLAMLSHLTRLLDPNTSWPNKVKDLVMNNQKIQTSHMGFPTGWEVLPIWQGAAA